LPWRWTAIEALVHPKYTTMSDIWSYGITIYEYFTCGALPFSSWSYCSEFVDLLKTGQLVPEKPTYASDTM
jgi:serine/threonine protein kinase